MDIIISQNGKDAKRITSTSFGNEAELQQYIYENPDVIPLDEDVRLLILARELKTASGPIDAIGVDANGQLYLIETKLYKNQDKRQVVAQVLDYGASLWRHYRDFDSFRAALDAKVQDKWNQSLEEKLASYFSLSPEEVLDIISSMRSNLDEGVFKFVVLMDQLHEQLKDLLRFINRFSRFSLFAVEVEYYKHDTYEIMIPRLFGAEVKKDAAVSRPRAFQIYTLDDHFEGSRAAMRPLYDKLEAAMRKTEPAIEFDPKQGHINFKVAGKTIFTMITRKSRLLMWFPTMDKSDFRDLNKRLRQDAGNQPNLAITGEGDLPDAVDIIEQALTFNKQ